eukprot:g6281.t1
MMELEDGAVDTGEPSLPEDVEMEKKDQMQKTTAENNDEHKQAATSTTKQKLSGPELAMQRLKFIDFEKEVIAETAEMVVVCLALKRVEKTAVPVRTRIQIVTRLQQYAKTQGLDAPSKADERRITVAAIRLATRLESDEALGELPTPKRELPTGCSVHDEMKRMAVEAKNDTKRQGVHATHWNGFVRQGTDLKVPYNISRNIDDAAEMVDQWMQSERRGAIKDEKELGEAVEEIASNIIAAKFWPRWLQLYLTEAINMLHRDTGEVMVDASVCLLTLYGIGFGIECGVRTMPKGNILRRQEMKAWWQEVKDNMNGGKGASLALEFEKGGVAVGGARAEKHVLEKKGCKFPVNKALDDCLRTNTSGKRVLPKNAQILEVEGNSQHLAFLSVVQMDKIGTDWDTIMEAGGQSGEVIASARTEAIRIDVEVGKYVSGVVHWGFKKNGTPALKVHEKHLRMIDNPNDFVLHPETEIPPEPEPREDRTKEDADEKGTGSGAAGGEIEKLRKQFEELKASVAGQIRESEDRQEKRVEELLNEQKEKTRELIKTETEILNKKIDDNHGDTKTKLQELQDAQQGTANSLQKMQGEQEAWNAGTTNSLKEMRSEAEEKMTRKMGVDMGGEARMDNMEQFMLGNTTAIAALGAPGSIITEATRWITELFLFLLLLLPMVVMIACTTATAMLIARKGVVTLHTGMSTLRQTRRTALGFAPLEDTEDELAPQEQKQTTMENENVNKTKLASKRWWSEKIEKKKQIGGKQVSTSKVPNPSEGRIGPGSKTGGAAANEGGTGGANNQSGVDTDMSDSDGEDDDEKELQAAASPEMVDPWATTKPKMIKRADHVVIWGYGAGVMLLDPTLRGQFERKAQGGTDPAGGRALNLAAAVRARVRVTAVYLDEMVLVAAYAPTDNYTREQQDKFDTSLVKTMREVKRRKSEKWKLRVVGGDWNCQIGRSEFGESPIHVGEAGADSTNPRGRRFAKVLMGGNMVMVNSKFPLRDGAYATQDAGHELDFFVTTGPCLQKFRSYQRININAPGGTARAPRRFDHLAIEVIADVKTKKRLKQEGEVRRLATMEILDHISDELRARFNTDLQERIARQGDLFRLEEFQDYLAEYLPEMMDKRRKRSKRDVPDAEKLAENASCRANMWRLFRDMKANEEAASGAGGKSQVTPEEARAKYDEVGNSPLRPDHEELEIAEELSSLVPRLSPEAIEELDKPVTAAELRTAVLRLRSGGRARDVHGLGPDMLMHFDDKSLQLLTGVLVKQLAERDISELGDRMHLCRDVMNAPHRSAKHSFGGELFDLRHGCKEGCPSSPLIFITAFTAVMRKYEIEMDRRAREKGAARGGILVRADNDVWHYPREDKIFSLVRCGHDSRMHLVDLLFADDTTLIEPMEAARLAGVLERDAVAKAQDKPFEHIDATEIFTRVISSCGLRENVSKRVQGDITEIVTRNLGVNTDPDEDARLKVLKAWKAYWTLRSRVSGLEGITNSRRGELVIIMVRGVLLYGLQARAVSEREIRILHREENRILGQMMDVKWWERRAYDLHYNDRRRRARIPPFRAHLRHLQAKFFGHTMRGPRDNATRTAMIGKFLPNGIGDYDLNTDVLRSEKNVKQLEPKKRIMPDVLGDVLKHLREDCRMPTELLRLLFESVEETKERRPDLDQQKLYAKNKAAYFACTRQWFVAETAKDWGRGCKWTREWAADKLAEKYYGDKKNKRPTRDQLRRAAIANEDDPEEMIRLHYRPPRNGAEGILRGVECIWCRKVVDPGVEEESLFCEPTGPMTLSAAMRAHLAEHHPVVGMGPHFREEQQAALRAAKQKDAARSEEIRCRVVNELEAEGGVSEVQQRGPKRHGRVTYVSKLRRHVCDLSFTTSAGAMKLHMHMEGHGRDDYTKIGQLCIPLKGYVYDEERKTRNEYRPEQHAVNRSTGQYYFGSDARLWRIDVPESARHVVPGTGEKRIRCRICKDKSFPYDDDLHNLQSRSQREEGCFK